MRIRYFGQEPHPDELADDDPEKARARFERAKEAYLRSTDADRQTRARDAISAALDIVDCWCPPEIYNDAFGNIPESASRADKIIEIIQRVRFLSSHFEPQDDFGAPRPLAALLQELICISECNTPILLKRIAADDKKERQKKLRYRAAMWYDVLSKQISEVGLSRNELAAFILGAYGYSCSSSNSLRKWRLRDHGYNKEFPRESIRQKEENPFFRYEFVSRLDRWRDEVRADGQEYQRLERGRKAK